MQEIEITKGGRSVIVGITDSLAKRFWGTIKIRLEGRVCLETNPEKFFSLFQELFSICHRNVPLRVGKSARKVIIDLTKAEFIYPSALLFLVSLPQSLHPEVELTFEVKEKGLVHEYLCNCGFGHIFKIPELPSEFRKLVPKGEVIEMESGTHVADEEAKARSFLDMVNKNNQMTTFFRNRSEESVSEILKNVKDHSRCTVFYLLGQGYPTSKNARFVVYDNGIGIKRHMTLLPYSKQHKYFQQKVSAADHKRIRESASNVAIEIASIYGVSATKYVHNSGAGLDFLINDFSKTTQGSVSILSGDGYVCWSAGKKVTSIPIPYEIHGTLVSITAKDLTG